MITMTLIYFVRRFFLQYKRKTRPVFEPASPVIT